MHQLRGGHMRLGSKPILRATLIHSPPRKEQKNIWEKIALCSNGPIAKG